MRPGELGRVARGASRPGCSQSAIFGRSHKRNLRGALRCARIAPPAVIKGCSSPVWQEQHSRARPGRDPRDEGHTPASDRPSVAPRGCPGAGVGGSMGAPSARRGPRMETDGVWTTCSTCPVVTPAPGTDPRLLRASLIPPADGDPGTGACDRGGFPPRHRDRHRPWAPSLDQNNGIRRD